MVVSVPKLPYLHLFTRRGESDDFRVVPSQCLSAGDTASTRIKGLSLGIKAGYGLSESLCQRALAYSVIAYKEVGSGQVPRFEGALEYLSG